MNLYVVLLLSLTIKHFLADWILQTNKIAMNKGKQIKYLAIHSFHHASLTLIIFIIFSSIQKALFIATLEFFIHSIIDFIKANDKLLGKYKYPSKAYFIFLGLDQTLHQLTYIFFALLG